MKQIIAPDHYTVITASKVLELCDLFFKISNTNGFCYARIFDHGEMFCLNTHPDWYVYHLNNQYPLVPAHLKINTNCRYSFILLPENVPQYCVKILDEIRERFGLDYPYLIAERHQDYCDIYIFSTAVKNAEIINFYLNRQSEIEKFKHYFKGYGKTLIAEAANHLVTLPPKMRVHFPDEEEKIIHANLLPKNYVIHLNKKDIFFTVKEAECLKYLSMGYDLKGVGKMMNISSRTVEFHLNNIKVKTGVNTVSKLLVLLNSLDTQMRFW